MTARLVVITGGPGSGKTSLVGHLGTLGYSTVPEAAIQIIEELNRDRGMPGQIQWRQENPAEFQRLVTKRQAKLEGICQVPEGGMAFCDRGRPDALAYAKLMGLELDAELQSLVQGHRYHRVYLLAPLSHFDERPATGRTSDRERAAVIYDLLSDAYRSLRYSPFRVPELPIDARARLVLRDLSESDANSRSPRRPTGRCS